MEKEGKDVIQFLGNCINFWISNRNNACYFIKDEKRQPKNVTFMGISTKSACKTVRCLFTASFV